MHPSVVSAEALAVEPEAEAARNLDPASSPAVAWVVAWAQGPAVTVATVALVASSPDLLAASAETVAMVVSEVREATAALVANHRWEEVYLARTAASPAMVVVRAVMEVPAALVANHRWEEAKWAALVYHL